MDKKAPKWLVEAPVTMDILADLKWKDGQNIDNMILDDFEVAVEELTRFKKAGGNSMVEATTVGLGREPEKLRRVSEATGVNIVYNTGFYCEPSLPAWVKKKSIEQLADIMVAEMEEGIEGTGIRAGVIGELGCQEPLKPMEAKVLAAGAKAQARTGAGLTIHTPLYSNINEDVVAKQVPQEVEILQKYDCDLSKVYISHSDFTFDDPKYQQKLMDEFGLTLNYDCFGQEQYFKRPYFGAGGVTDGERARALANLVKLGYAKQLMMACDVCEKIHLRKYGGYGYSNVLEHVVPFLELLGVSEKQVRTMMVDNPKRVLQK
jgi:phosphotriesterase-related protein